MEIEFTADDGTLLAGSLDVPTGSGPFPAALILNGSGPLDRDSNMPGQVLGVAPALSDTLAERGIASLRFDKRGVGGSGGEFLTTSFERETGDAAAALEYLAAREEVDPGRLLVIGHSVGGTIAIRLAAGPRPLAGGVLLACSTQNGEEVMRDQTDRIAATLRGLQRFGAGRLRRRQAEVREQLLSSSEDVLRIEGHDQPARWLREFMRYEPARDLPRIACPVMAVIGEHDVQVDPAEVERMRGLVTAPFTGANPAGLSHLLRMSSGPPGLAGYPKQLERPVDEALLDLVGTWAAEVVRS